MKFKMKVLLLVIVLAAILVEGTTAEVCTLQDNPCPANCTCPSVTGTCSFEAGCSFPPPGPTCPDGYGTYSPGGCFCPFACWGTIVGCRKTVIVSSGICSDCNPLNPFP